MNMLPLPPGPFGTIVADPAWRFRDRAVRGAAEKHYPTMDWREIAQLPVNQIATPNAHLYCWTTDTHLLDGSALKVVDVWGFRPIQLICWRKIKEDLGILAQSVIDLAGAEKYTPEEFHRLAVQLAKAVRDPDAPQIGTGHYFRHCFEVCIFAVRGKAPPARRDVLALFDAPRTRMHSEKPDRIFELAEAMSPGPYLEMFARVARPGWTTWGLEAPAPAMPNLSHCRDCGEFLTHGHECKTAQPAMNESETIPSDLIVGNYYALADGRLVIFEGVASKFSFFAGQQNGGTVKFRAETATTQAWSVSGDGVECPVCKWLLTAATNGAKQCLYCKGDW